MGSANDLRGKTVFIIGGSGGLGREMSKVIAAQGAHITIFGRKQDLLDKARNDILAVRQVESQVVNAVAGDMGIAHDAHSILNSQPQIPDVLYCVAGGTPAECGFLLDLEPQILERCMTNNYYSSLYPAQAVLKRWVGDDIEAEIPPSPKLRKIVFVNSSASLVPVPGYLAYSAAKAAQRALADTMRLEVMRYSGPKSTYAVQCIFAHNYITQTFLEEQKMKPDLCKRIEGTAATDLATLEKHFPYAAKIAPEIVTNDFAVTDKRLEPQLFWASGLGSSPKRGWGIVDSLLALLASFLIFPFVRRDMEKKCKVLECNSMYCRMALVHGELVIRALEQYDRTMPPIRGCIHAAMALNDSIFDNMSYVQWQHTVLSKVQTSWNLHNLLSADLDFFIMLSSVAGVIGNISQANYAAGCTFQDSLARYRVRHGQTAVSIDLGVMRDIGHVAETEVLRQTFEGRLRNGQIEEKKFMAGLDMCCDPTRNPSYRQKHKITMGIVTPDDLLAHGNEVGAMLQRPLFAHFSQIHKMSLTSRPGNQINFSLLFRRAESVEERSKVAVRSLAMKLARALSIQPEDVDAEQPLHMFGVDSLVAVELRNWIAKEFAAEVPVFEIMGGRSVAAIGELVTKASQIGKGNSGV